MYLVGLLYHISFGKIKCNIYKRDVHKTHSFVCCIFFSYFLNHFYCTGIAFAGDHLNQAYINKPLMILLIRFALPQSNYSKITSSISSVFWPLASL